MADQSLQVCILNWLKHFEVDECQSLHGLFVVVAGLLTLDVGVVLSQRNAVLLHVEICVKRLPSNAAQIRDQVAIDQLLHGQVGHIHHVISLFQFRIKCLEG